MWKLLSMPLYFFRELIFESKDEYNINSSDFNTKKVMAFSIIVMSLILNILLIWRVLDLALENIEIKDALHHYHPEHDALKGYKPEEKFEFRPQIKPEEKPTKPVK